MKIYGNTSRDRFYSSCAIALCIYIMLMVITTIVLILQWSFIVPDSSSFIVDITFSILFYILVPAIISALAGLTEYIKTSTQRYEVFIEDNVITINSTLGWTSSLIEFEVSNIISVNKISYHALIKNRNIVVKVKGYSINGYFHRLRKQRIVLVPICSKEERNKIVQELINKNPNIEIKLF